MRPVPRASRLFFHGLLVVAFGIIAVGILPATAATAASTPPPENAGVGIRLVDIPAETKDDPRAQAYIVDALPPGTTIERRIEVSNQGSNPQVVEVYAGSAHITDGSFVGDEMGKVNELTTWISVGSTQVQLDSGETAMVPVTINVPADAAEQEQYAVIWAQVTSSTTDGSGVALASRSGIRVYLAVGPGNGAPADFEIDGLTSSRTNDGIPEVRATVTNTGGRALDLSGTLTLSDGPASTSAGPFHTENPSTIAPGESGDVLVQLDAELSDGPWTAEITLTSGLLSKSVSGEVTFTPGEAALVEIAPSRYVVVSVVMGSALILILALIAFVLFRRRRASTRAS